MNDINYNTINRILESQKLNNIVNHYCNKWKNEYLCNLRGHTNRINYEPHYRLSKSMILL